MKQDNIPDPTLHKYISFVKSAFCIAAGVFLFGLAFKSAGVLGIAEEMV